MQKYEMSQRPNQRALKLRNACKNFVGSLGVAYGRVQKWAEWANLSVKYQKCAERTVKVQVYEIDRQEQSRVLYEKERHVCDLSTSIIAQEGVAFRYYDRKAFRGGFDEAIDEVNEEDVKLVVEYIDEASDAVAQKIASELCRRVMSRLNQDTLPLLREIM